MIFIRYEGPFLSDAWLLFPTTTYYITPGLSCKKLLKWYDGITPTLGAQFCTPNLGA